jgi:hypothetical protein
VSDENLRAIVQRQRTLELSPGIAVELSAFTIRDWARIEEEALAAAKRDLIKTYTANQDLLDEASRKAILSEAFQRAETLRLDNVPPVKIDAGDGEPIELPFTVYWMGRTLSGLLYTVWLSARHSKPELTLDDVSKYFSVHRSRLDEAANIVGEISRPTLGNA